MFFDEEEKDWKESLSDEDKETLANMFDQTRKYKHAYSNADDVKIAQLWCALIEMKKELDEVKKTLGVVQEPFKAIIAAGEAEKKKTIERLVSEIIKPTDEDTQEATQKLVESLMKF